MRVFVTGVGRCGTVSFYEACRFMTNYTTSHKEPARDQEYPQDNHIAVNPQLRVAIMRVVKKYPTSLWVQLTRAPQTNNPSLVAAGHGSVMQAYGSMYTTMMDSLDLADVAAKYYQFENDRITALLHVSVPPSQRRIMRLETIKEDWPKFWKWIGAEGDYAASLRSWDTPHNTREQRGEA